MAAYSPSARIRNSSVPGSAGAGTTYGMSTPRAWSSAACHSFRFATCLGTRQSRRRSKDNQKLENLQIAAAKLESGMTFEPPEPVRRQ